MPILIALLVIVAAVWLFSRASKQGGGGAASAPARKRCKWVAEGDTTKTLRAYTCTRCGITAYSAEPGGPKECKREFGGRSL